MKKIIAVAILSLAITVGFAKDAVPEWKKDVSTAPIPAAPVSGMAHGVKFKVEKAKIQNGILSLRQGKNFFADQEFKIFTFLKKGENLAGKKFIVKPNGGFGSPHVHFSYKIKNKNLPKTEMFMNKYTMKLEFGKVSGKKISGKIYLCLPDKAKSFIAGSFEAEIK